MEHAIEDVVDESDAGAGDLAEVPVEREPGLNGDRGAEQRPGEHGQQIPQGQSDQHVPGAGAEADQERADDELRGGDVLAGVDRGKVGATLELVGGDGLPLELIEFVEALEEALRFVVYGHERKGKVEMENGEIGLELIAWGFGTQAARGGRGVAHGGGRS